MNSPLKEIMNKIMLESDEYENEGLKAIQEHEDCTDLITCEKCGKEIKETDIEGTDYYYYKEVDKILCSKCGDYEDALSQQDEENYCDNPYCLNKNCEEH